MSSEQISSEPMIIEPISEPIIEPMISEPISEPIIEPISESIAEPISESIIEQIIEPISEPISEPIAEPISESIAEPKVEQISEPIAEPKVEQISEPIIEPISEPIAEPTVEPIAEPTVEPIAETKVEPTVEQIAEPKVEFDETRGFVSEIISEIEIRLKTNSDEPVFGENIFDKLFPDVTIGSDDDATKQKSESICEGPFDDATGVQSNIVDDSRNVFKISVNETRGCDGATAKQSAVTDPECGTPVKYSECKPTCNSTDAEWKCCASIINTHEKMDDVNLLSDVISSEEIPKKKKKGFFKTWFGWLF